MFIRICPASRLNYIIRQRTHLAFFFPVMCRDNLLSTLGDFKKPFFGTASVRSSSFQLRREVPWCRASLKIPFVSPGLISPTSPSQKLVYTRASNPGRGGCSCLVDAFKFEPGARSLPPSLIRSPTFSVERYPCSNGSPTVTSHTSCEN